MGNEPPPSSSASRGLLGRLWRLLADQRTGIVCSWLAAALLAIGSIWMDRRADHYAGLELDDLRFFVSPWRPEHGWLYAAALVLAVWGASTLVCIVTSLGDRIARRVTRLSAFGAPIVHLTFLLALVAHGYGGMTARGAQYMVGPTWTTVGEDALRASSLEESLHPNGMPRQVRATVERERGGQLTALELGYNQPITSGWGSSELMLVRHQLVAGGARLIHRGQPIELGQGERGEIAGDELRLRAVFDRGGSRGLRVPVADLVVNGERLLLPLDADGGSRAAGSPVEGHPGLAMVPGRSSSGAASETAFVGISRVPVLLLAERHNPSVPLVIVMALLLAIGVVLVVLERRRRDRRRGMRGAERRAP